MKVHGCKWISQVVRSIDEARADGKIRLPTMTAESLTQYTTTSSIPAPEGKQGDSKGTKKIRKRNQRIDVPHDVLSLGMQACVV